MCEPVNVRAGEVDPETTKPCLAPSPADGLAKELKPELPPSVRETVNADIVQLGTYFLRTFAAFFLVYCMGYYGFSLAWIIVAIIIYVLREKFRREKDFKLQIARSSAVNEKASILARVEDLPSWVYFPDTERAEWINKMLHQLWPYVGHYVKDFLIDNVEPTMNETMKSTTRFGSFKFAKIDLGDIPPRVGGIKVYREQVSRHEIIMDIELFYAGDCDIEVVISKIKAGIKDLQLHGSVRIIFKPLINEMPLIGGLQVFFLNTPVIDFNLTNMADVLDMPGLGDILRKIIGDQIASFMVLPNKYFIKLSDSVSTQLLNFTQPAGVIRVDVIEAKDLMKKDVNMLGFGKSDPYGIITVGAQEFKTKVINNTINPVWDFHCEALVDQLQDQSIDLEFFDKDQGNQDDSLGRVSIDIQTIACKGSADMWIPLEDAKTGQVHLNFKWLGLSKDALDLEVHEKDQFVKDSGLSTCLLLVYVDSAKNLPNASKSPVEPCPLLRMSFGCQKRETGACRNTNNPVWEDSFSFLVANPEVQDLIIDVIDQKTQKILGNMTYTTSRLLHLDNLETNQPFQLKNSGPQSKLVLTLQLRILKAGITVPMELRSEGSDAGSERSPSESGSRPGSARASPAHIIGGNQARDPIPPIDTKNTVMNAVTDTLLDGQPTLPQGMRAGTESVRRRNILETTSTNGSPKRYCGRVQLTLRYSQQRNRLIVVVHKATELPTEGGEALDPYVKMYLQPDRKGESKKKTQIIKNTCNPVYDETFDYMMTPTDLSMFQLLITANNRSTSMFTKSAVLGQATLDLGQLDLSKAVTDWFTLELDHNESGT